MIQSVGKIIMFQGIDRMNKKTDSTKSDMAAKILLIIPLGSFLSGVALFILSLILESPTSRGTLYSICFIIAIACFILALFPGVILSIIGTVTAAKKKMTKYLTLGVLEIVFAVGGAFILWYLIYVAGPGV